LIVAAGGRQIDRVDVLYEALDGAAPGGELELTILRGTDERAVSVTF
jgi:S1-C subfamily serine protease